VCIARIQIICPLAIKRSSALDTMHKLFKISEGLNKRFPNNENPFRILARLMEESGELADQVHKFERVGREIKLQEPPDKENMAKECMDIMTSVLNIVMYYGVQSEFEAKV